MRVIAGGSYDITQYVLTRPRIKSVSNVVNGSLYIPESTITLQYVRGLFDTQTPTFKADTTIEVYSDNGTLLFVGFVRGVQQSYTETTLTCVHYLNKILSGNINYSASATHPALILASFLDSIGQAHTGILSYQYKYPSMLCQVFATPENGIKAYDFVSSLCDLLSIDIVVDAGTVYAIDRTQTVSDYTLKSMAYPQVLDDGTARQIKGCNLRYLFDADIPLSIGTQTEYCWSADYGPNNYLQVFGTGSATEICNAKLDRLSTARQIIQLKVRDTKYVAKIGMIYNVDAGPVQGYYRVVGQETDGELYYPIMEACQ